MPTTSPELREHELARALRRIVACIGCLLVWAFAFATGSRVDRKPSSSASLPCVLGASLLYLVLLRGGRVPSAFASTPFSSSTRSSRSSSSPWIRAASRS